MSKLFTVALVAALVMGGAYAELQNIEVGGKIELDAVYDSYNSEVPGSDTDDSNANKYMEQRTRLNVKADFTDEITAFIEFDDSETWGEDFRSDYITGQDFRAAHGDSDVEIFQSYIEMREFFGMPLTIKAGRQEILLGDGWLVGPNEAPDPFTGLSFDAITAMYEADMFSVTGIWAKLSENSPAEEDGDVDMYGLYGSYTGFDNLVIDAYWLFVRDARQVGTPDDTVNLHTIGVRVAGDYNAFDYVGELAYQFGDIEAAAAPLGFTDDDADAFAVRGEVGYTFDMNYQPRVYLGGQWYEGDDDTAPFDRLFSDFVIDPILDGANSNLTNVWMIQGGVTAAATEAIEVGFDVKYLQLDEDFGNEDQLGWQTTLSAAYQYSEDLAFEAGWTHFFADDDGIENLEGIADADDDFNYLYAYTSIEF